MTLGELKRKVFSLIEELDTSRAELTADPDLALKINDVVCQVLYELARQGKTVERKPSPSCISILLIPEIRPFIYQHLIFLIF